MPPRARAARVATISAATKASIKAAHEAGRASEKYASSESRYISVDGNKLTLILPDGRLTLYGSYYYRDLLQLDPPKLFSFETPLIQDKWVMAYSGRKLLVRRRGADGQWQPTKLGLQYFKFLRDEYSVSVGSYRVSGNGRTPVPSPPQVLSDKGFVTEYISNPEATLAYRRLNTEEERLRFIKTAAYNYLDTLPTIVVGGVEFKVLHYDSTPIVWDGSKADMTFSRMRIQFFDDGTDTNDVILNRPLLDFTLPDFCWRPYDLHENCQ